MSQALKTHGSSPPFGMQSQHPKGRKRDAKELKVGLEEMGAERVSLATAAAHVIGQVRAVPAMPISSDKDDITPQERALTHDDPMQWISAVCLKTGFA